MSNIQSDSNASHDAHMHDVYHFAEFGRLSAGIFHDLMNHLNAVVANVSEAERHTSENDEAKHYMQRAILASKRMGALLGMIRSHIAPRQESTYFSLNEELSDVLTILNHRIVRSKAMIFLHDKTPIMTFGNHLKFHQIALNLISNAIDACQGKEGLEARITIELSKKNAIAVFAVSDTGTGISPEIIDKIFTRFFTTKKASQGFGLGLSITKEMIEGDFQGSIEIESAPGHGATFRVSIPIREKPE